MMMMMRMMMMMFMVMTMTMIYNPTVNSYNLVFLQYNPCR